MGLNLMLVDDDTAFAAVLADELRAFGHDVQVAADGRAALNAVDSQAFDALILDRRMPGIDGIAVVRRLRDIGMTLPVIMMSALGRSAEKIAGLEAGADDYVAKPVVAAEIDARLAAILRGRRWTAGPGDTLHAGDIVVSPTRFRAWRGGVALDLGKLEFRLLAAFVGQADAVLTRAMLTERIWGHATLPATNVVDVHVRNLRVKLTAGGGHDPIVTVRGVGYMLRG